MLGLSRSDILDKYEIMNVVGEGSYGTVHRARNKDTGRMVAIKKFFEEDSDKTVHKIAQRELRALRRLRHENLVNMLEFTKKRRKLYIVFEYVEGTVLDFMENSQNKRVDSVRAAEIMWQVTRAIEFIHQHRMIHRDVKPENILYSKDGVIKLCDFGFARSNMLGKGEHFTDYVATRWYRAPELLVKEGKYGDGVDIWSIGCLLPELLSGDPLLPGKSDLDQLAKVIALCGHLPTNLCESFRQKPEFLSNRIPEPKHEPVESRCRILRSMPEALDFVKKCLDLDKTVRANATELLQHQYFRTNDFQGRLPDLIDRIQKFNRSRNSKSKANNQKIHSVSSGKLPALSNIAVIQETVGLNAKKSQMVQEIKSMPDIGIGHGVAPLRRVRNEVKNKVQTKLPKL